MQKHEAGVNDRAVELFRNGRRDEARSTLETFLEVYPQSTLAHVNLGYMLLVDGEVDAARRAYEQALRLQPDNVQACHGLASVFHALQDDERSRRYFAQACRLAPIRLRPCRGAQPARNVLLLCSASIANLNAFALLDDAVFAVTTAFVEYVGGEVLKGQDVIFNAISEPEIARDALSKAAALIADARVPVLNRPERIGPTTRDATATRLAAIAGIVAPAVSRVPKDRLALGELPAHMSYPVIVRSPGRHDGRCMTLVESAQHLTRSVDDLPGDDLFVIEYADVRSLDGNVRKYRMMIVGDELYPLHLAISRRWKVHYVTADMELDSDNRTEDERFVTDPRSVLGEQALATLHAVRQVLGLDYGGIDFSIDRSGKVVVFEANASMFVPEVPPDPRWGYRRPPTARIREAVTRLLAGS